MRITLTVWRQPSPTWPGKFETYDVPGVSPDMVVLEMLVIVNERLMHDGKEPIAFGPRLSRGHLRLVRIHDQRQAHGPERAETATCQLHMRKFRDGDHLTIEPWRARGFPLVKDLIVDRSSFDRIIESGGYIGSVRAAHPDGNLIPIPKPVADASMDAARASAAAHCVPRARTARHNCSRRRRCSTSNLLPQPGRALGSHDRHGRDHGDLLRVVHQPPGMRGRVPESPISIDFIALNEQRTTPRRSSSSGA